MTCSHNPVCQKSLSWKTIVQQALVNTYLWRPGDTEVLMSYTNHPVANKQELWIYEQIGKKLRKKFETHCPFQHLCLINSPSVSKSSTEKNKTVFLLSTNSFSLFWLMVQYYTISTYFIVHNGQVVWPAGAKTMSCTTPSSRRHPALSPGKAVKGLDAPYSSPSG